MREIRCMTCNADLGEIRDARLRKDIEYICGDCSTIVSDIILQVQYNKLMKNADKHIENIYDMFYD